MSESDTSSEHLEVELAAAYLPEATDHWTDQQWIKDQFPYQKGMGRQQPPQEHIFARASDSDRRAEVIRWRGLTSGEQWNERQALGHKKPPPRRKNQPQQAPVNIGVIELERGLATLNIGGGETNELQNAIDPSLQEEANAVINETASAPISYLGLLDSEESRINHVVDRIASKEKATDHRIIGSRPHTKAQIKDRKTSDVRKSIIQQLYTYITMTTPPEVDAKGNSSAHWPKLKVALVIVDGFKPNRANGGRRKDGTERRDKVMVAFMSGSVDDCAEVLHCIKEGIIFNTQGSLHPIYECCCFAYNYEDAIASDQRHSTTLPPQTNDVQQQNSGKSCTELPSVDWENQASILKHYPLWKGKGDRQVPLDYLLQTYHSHDSRQKFVFQWRRYTRKAQLEFEQNIALKTTVQTNIRRRKILTSAGVIPSVEQSLQSITSDASQVKSKRKVGSQPSSKAGIKDAVTSRVLNNLIKRVYTYIAMTTPASADVEKLQLGDWPRLKVGLIIVDELKPNRLKGGVAYRDGEERREKKLVRFITGSEDDRNEILEAIDDSILSSNEKKLSRYDPIFATNVKDANATDYFRFESVRNRPPARVLSVDEIAPTIHYHWNLVMPCSGSSYYL